VLEDTFVVANDAEAAGEVASATPEPVPGAEGAIVATADAEALAGALLEQVSGLEGLGGIGAGLVIAPLGDASGSLESSPERVRGSVRLTLE
jgi:hypothetical protein